MLSARAHFAHIAAICIAAAGCSESDDSSPDDAASPNDTAEASDTTTSTDTGLDTNGSLDSGSDADAGLTDTADAGSADTWSESGSDVATDVATDAAPVDPCTPLPAGLTTWTKTDSASVGTPDTYFFDVNPGDPFCASITGGGGGVWSVNVSNGTSSGVYCSGSSKCSIVVPAGQPTLLVTAVTTDIGGYTLTVRYRPR